MYVGGWINGDPDTITTAQTAIYLGEGAMEWEYR